MALFIEKVEKCLIYHQYLLERIITANLVIQIYALTSQRQLLLGCVETPMIEITGDPNASVGSIMNDGVVGPHGENLINALGKTLIDLFKTSNATITNYYRCIWEQASLNQKSIMYHVMHMSIENKTA